MTGHEVVAVLGAGGTMGRPIAANIARAGIEVRAWNRSREKAEPLAADGARIADTPAAAADGASLILTMLADADAVIDSMDGDRGGLASANASTVWIQMGTIGETGTERCAELARKHGVVFVDAPVLGTRQPAADGKLIVLSSGPEDARDRVQPIFDAIAQKTIWVGEAGAGTLLKLVTNSWVLAVVEAGAETIALAEGLGLDPSLFFDAIDGGPLDLPYLRMKGKAISERDFEPAFKLRLAAKDAKLVDDSATRRDLDLPLLRVVAERLAEGVGEHGDEDLSATYLTSAPTSARRA
jgi:3-hydroxyisobutyrate dehydrogenase